MNRDAGNFVFGDSYFGDETVAGPGAGTAVPLGEAWYTGDGGTFNGPTSQFVEDGGFVKLREISLGYTFDQPWVSRLLGFSSMELRVAGRNLHTWTNYTGVDPETSLLGVGQPAAGNRLLQQPAEPVVRVLTHSQPLILTRTGVFSHEKLSQVAAERRPRAGGGGLQRLSCRATGWTTTRTTSPV